MPKSMKFASHAALTLANEMTPEEQKQLTSLLLREGITGLLQRLGIRDQN
jgi:hypothetical protein